MYRLMKNIEAMHRLYSGLTEEYRPLIGVLRANSNVSFESAVLQLDQYKRFGTGSSGSLGGASANAVQATRQTNTFCNNRVTCFNCGEVGHKKDTCKSQRNPNVRTCFNCKLPGHVSKFCTKEKIIRCLACDAVGHYKSDCPVLKRAGHISNSGRDNSSMARNFHGNAAETKVDTGTSSASASISPTHDPIVTESRLSAMFSKLFASMDESYTCQVVTAFGVFFFFFF